MRIYRGPRWKDFYEGDDESPHSLVDEVPVPPSPWSSTTVIRANVSKNAEERVAVIHIEFEVSDVLNLHRGLLEGLIARSEQAERTISALRQTLRDVRQTARTAGGASDAATLGAIVARVDNALNNQIP